jgi:UDPglucose--hexose-1-phosphate uridylyltransferase
MTPPEIYRLNGEDGRWRVRVVPNKFPALQDYPQLDHTAQGKVFENMTGVGAHEVVIDSPEHTRDIPDLPLDQVEAIVDTYILRLKNLMAKSAHRYVLLFKNHGKTAGASLAHSHSQIIATPFIPNEVQARLQSSKKHYKEHNRCLLCELIAEELRVGERIIEESNGYVVVAPYASRFPFEMRISPRVHTHDFTTLSRDERQGLAQILQRTLARLKSLLNDPPYNIILQTAPSPVSMEEQSPTQISLADYYHWHIEIIPRLTTMAGFEWGSGAFINPTPPEVAARYLRDIDLST